MVRNFGRKFKKITSLIRWNIDRSEAFKSNPDLTNVTGWTIGFIFKRSENNILTYQKDIEKEFKISRSTASGLLNTMEEHGYIYREVSTVDSRLKMIYLTDEAIKLHNKVLKSINDLRILLFFNLIFRENKCCFIYSCNIKV